jgi:hypothetical protein
MAENTLPQATLAAIRRQPVTTAYALLLTDHLAYALGREGRVSECSHDCFREGVAAPLSPSRNGAGVSLARGSELVEAVHDRPQSVIYLDIFRCPPCISCRSDLAKRETGLVIPGIGRRSLIG